MSRRALLGFAVLGLTIIGLGCLDNNPNQAVRTDSARKADQSIPIRHFIYIIQENITYDHYFGTYPGGNGFRRTRSWRTCRAARRTSRRFTSTPPRSRRT